MAMADPEGPDHHADDHHDDIGEDDFPTTHMHRAENVPGARSVAIVVDDAVEPHTASAARPEPKRPWIMPSDMKGTRMNQLVAPTNFMTDTSRRRAKMAMRIELRMRTAAEMIKMTATLKKTHLKTLITDSSVWICSGWFGHRQHAGGPLERRHHRGPRRPGFRGHTNTRSAYPRHSWTPPRHSGAAFSLRRSSAACSNRCRAGGCNSAGRSGSRPP